MGVGPASASNHSDQSVFFQPAWRARPAYAHLVDLKELRGGFADRRHACGDAAVPHELVTNAKVRGNSSVFASNRLQTHFRGRCQSRRR